MKPSELRKYSLITWTLERAFYVLQRLSIATWLLGTRVGAQSQFSNGADKEAITKRRGTLIEVYIFAWFAVEVVLILIANNASHITGIVISVIAIYRLIDILQACLNLNLFDRLRVQARQMYVAALARTAVLSVWNFIESIICFGILYACNRCLLKNATDGLDVYYFSTATQLTIGYGDVTPTGFLRGFAMAQGVMGFVLGIFAISRIISFLPKTQSVLGDE